MSYLVYAAATLILTAIFALPVKEALAVCPVCTVAVGAGLGLSRFLGIDDTISGLWVGGLILSTSLWLTNWLRSKNLTFKLMDIAVIAAMYLITIVPLWLGKIIGHPFNQLWGVDKLVFGTVLGSGLFLLAIFVDKRLRKIIGHQFFPYQKVAFPVSSLLILSLILYFILK